jgi:hypothetical protein
MRIGDSCWLKGRSSGEKRPVTRDIKTTTTIIIIIIIMSPNSWYG